MFGHLRHIPLKPLLVLVFMASSLSVLCQISWKGSFSTGYAFNHALYLNEERVHGAHGATVLGAGMVRVPLTSLFFIEAGLAAKLVFASGEVRLTRYSSKTLRACVPILIGRKFSDRLRVLSGVSVQNNRDFSVFRAREKYNLRYNLLLQGQYRISRSWFVTQSLEYNVGIPDAYLVNDPKMAVSVGFLYHINNMERKE